NGLARLGVSIQIVAEQARNLPTQLLGAAQFVPVVSEIVDLVADLDENTERAEASTRRLAGLYAQLDLITSIQAGVDPVEALTAALGQAADEGANVEAIFEDLAGIAGLDGLGLAIFVQNVV